MPFANVNGIKFHFQRVGKGPDVVMIHGLAANLAFWYFRIIPFLMIDFCITAYDLRGHGKSEMSDSGYTSADMAADLDALLDHLGVEKAHLVGHSFGGQVALHYATLRPERVLSLTVADTRVRALQPLQRLKDWPQWESTRRGLSEMGIDLSGEEPEIGHHLLREFASFKELTTRTPLAKVSNLFVPFGVRASGRRSAQRWLKLYCTTTAARDFMSMSGLTRRKLRTVHQPVLAVYGERSGCLRTLRRLQKTLPDCRTVIVPKVGHFHPVIKPGFFAQSVRTFLTSLGDPNHTGDGQKND